VATGERTRLTCVILQGRKIGSHLINSYEWKGVIRGKKKAIFPELRKWIPEPAWKTINPLHEKLPRAISYFQENQ